MGGIDGVASGVGECGNEHAGSKSHGDGCICHGNWRLIVRECSHLIGKMFASKDGVQYRFFGVVHADDDYYYGMQSKAKGLSLLSCVGSLESWGLELADDGKPASGLEEQSAERGGSGSEANRLTVSCEERRATGAFVSTGSGVSEGLQIGDTSTPANRLATVIAEGLGANHPAMKDLAMVLLGAGFEKA